jgi:hypothetical protein
MNARRPLLDNQIDKRTKLGRDLVRRTKELGDPLSFRAAEAYDLHPGLVGIPIKYLDAWFNKVNIN